MDRGDLSVLVRMWKHQIFCSCTAWRFGASGKPCAGCVCCSCHILLYAQSSLGVPGFPAQCSAAVQEILCD